MENTVKLDTFTTAYIEAALWSSTELDSDTALDKNHSQSDISAETMQQIIQDCEKFQSDNAELLSEGYEADGQDMRQAGHDFWFTRAGHGCGFWDGCWPETGDRLTAAAKEFREIDLYVGDDEKIYAM